MSFSAKQSRHFRERRVLINSWGGVRGSLICGEVGMSISDVQEIDLKCKQSPHVILHLATDTNRWALDTRGSSFTSFCVQVHSINFHHKIIIVVGVQLNFTELLCKNPQSILVFKFTKRHKPHIYSWCGRSSLRYCEPNTVFMSTFNIVDNLKVIQDISRTQ